MTVRIATFNTENLFRRPRVFNLKNDEAREQILNDYRKLTGLLEKEDYDVETDGKTDRTRIAELILKHVVEEGRETPPPFFVNETRGQHTLFQVKHKDRKPFVVVVAGGRSDWTGWVELVRDDLGWPAVQNTARVVAEIDADILLVVEVEDRTTLRRFNKQLLGDVLKKAPYPYELVLDGNDPRGIDIGILSRFPITSVRSHVFDLDPDRPGKRLFSRDCPEFELDLGGPPLWVLGCHFKSQSGDNPELRLAQAQRTATIYQAARERSPHIVVAGDFNDSPDSQAVKALLSTGLQDAMSHSSFPDSELPGTIGTATSRDQKFDYLMFSPELWELVADVGVERRGVWAPRTFDHFDEVKSKETQASDHAALFADLER